MGVIVDVDIKTADFWHDAFDIFRKKAIASQRLTSEDVAVSDEELLRSLNFAENDYLYKIQINACTFNCCSFYFFPV